MYLRMAVKDTPKHPVAVGTSLSTSAPSRHLNNLLGMVILNGVIAGQLHQVVARNALSAVDRKRLLQAAQLVRRLLRCQHLDNLAAVRRSLGNGNLADNRTLTKLVRADNENGPRRQGISDGSTTLSALGRGQAARRGGDARGKVGAVVARVVPVPGAVADDDAGHQRGGQAAKEHGGPQRLLAGGVLLLATSGVVGARAGSGGGVGVEEEEAAVADRRGAWARDGADGG